MENIKAGIIEEVKGRILEDIVMLDTMKENEGKGRSRRVFKIRFSGGEYVMVTADSTSRTCGLCEIRHSKEIHPGQYRHLVDRTMTDAVEAVYGKITARIVLYRGEDHLLDNGIEYRNVGEYLKKRV